LARCKLGTKKLNKYSKIFGLKFVKGLVRGNTDHRVDLYLENGERFATYPDRKLYKLNGFEFVEVNSGG
jgi:hypothetical protein